MLEAYLFVDPLCQDCLHSEKIVLKLAKQVKGPCCLRFIPMLSLKIINNTFSLDKIKHNYHLHYDIVMDYKAALFQGQKRGRYFFTHLQNKLVNLHTNYTYNNQLVFTIAKSADLDLRMFKSDRRSKLAIAAFRADQRLVKEMKITHPSSAVIFNWGQYNYGLKFTEINYWNLLKACCPRQSVVRNNRVYDLNGIPVPNVHLI